MEERKIQVDGIDINYVRVGNGQHPVLLLPGVLGAVWLNFKYQLENMDRDKFTLVAWEPPGYGRSRPPDRTFPDDFYHRDASWACNLMTTLGYEKFSIIGFCDGGITSLILAGTYREKIRKMVTYAAKAYITPGELETFKCLTDIDIWMKKAQESMVEVYGTEYVVKTWTLLADVLTKISKEQNGNICKELLPNIKCPTLIIQPAKDRLMSSEHPTYLHKAIAGSTLHIFENGGHFVHLKRPAEFTALVTEFLSEP